MPIKYANEFCKPLGFWVECPYCGDDSNETDQIDRGVKIECNKCKKVFLSKGWSV